MMHDVRVCILKGSFQVLFVMLFKRSRSGGSDYHCARCCRLDECLELLVNTGRMPEAAFFARTYLPSQISR